jgi:hypothetical protein
MPDQKPLFDEPASDLVRVPGTPGGAPPTKAQKAFNRLIEKIELQRQSLAAWQAFMPLFQQRVVAEIEPLQQRCAEARRSLAQVFDVAHDRVGTTKREQAKLAVLVLDLCEELLRDSEGGDAALIALHDKYSDASHAERKEEESRFLVDMAETVFGVDLGEGQDLGSPETIRAALHRKLHEEQAARAEQIEQAALPEPPARRKSAKALAKEAREAAQAQAATMSVREIFRKLASALHPDRETDPAERARKTELMQQVNQAYQKADLLRLLELQIQAEQIDRAALGSISEQRLGHYNQVLAEQSAQLEHEIDSLTLPFQHQTGAFGGSLKPETLSRTLDGDVAALRHELRRIEHDAKRLADRAVLKAWLRGLKVQRQRGRDAASDEVFDAFDSTR